MIYLSHITPHENQRNKRGYLSMEISAPLVLQLFSTHGNRFDARVSERGITITPDTQGAYLLMSPARGSTTGRYRSVLSYSKHEALRAWPAFGNMLIADATQEDMLDRLGYQHRVIYAPCPTTDAIKSPRRLTKLRGKDPMPKAAPEPVPNPDAEALVQAQAALETKRLKEMTALYVPGETTEALARLWRDCPASPPRPSLEGTTTHRFKANTYPLPQSNPPRDPSAQPSIPASVVVHIGDTRTHLHLSLKDAVDILVKYNRKGG